MNDLFKMLLGAAVLATLAACELTDLGTADNQGQQAMTCEPSDPNAYVFDHAVCLCESMDKRGRGITAESFSSFGTNEASEHLGHVGVNQSVEEVGRFDVDGNLEVGATMRGVGHLDVAGELFVGSQLSTQGHIWVGGDALVGGDFDGRGHTTVDGALLVGGAASYRGFLATGSMAEGVAIEPRTPCDCDPASLIDVAAEVAANSAATPLGLTSGRGHREMTLAGGKYFSADGAELRGSTEVLIEGPVQVYVGGDLELRGRSFIRIAEGASLDLYIAGNLRKFGNLSIVSATGAPASRAVRVYVGGSETVEIELRGRSVLEGSLYAPQADLLFRGNLTVYGSVFARNLFGRGRMFVYYDAGLIGIGEACDGDGDGSGDDQAGGDGDGSGGDDAVCSEERPDLCPEGVYDGDGDSSGDGSSGTGSGGRTGTGTGTGSGDGSGDGSGGDDGAGDDGTIDGAGDGSSGDDGTSDGASGDGDGACSEERPDLCPGSIYEEPPTDSSDSASGDGRGGGGAGPGDGTGDGIDGTSDGSDGTSDGSDGTSDGSDGTSDGSSDDGMNQCTEENIEQCM